MAAPLAFPFATLGIITVTTAGTPVQASATALKTRAVYLTAIKAKGTANSGTNAYVLDSAGHILFVIPKALTSPYIIIPRLSGVSDQIDLSTWWIDADTSADGLLITYQL